MIVICKKYKECASINCKHLKLHKQIEIQCDLNCSNPSQTKIGDYCKKATRRLISEFVLTELQ